MGNELTKELRASLETDPTPYLFTESTSARPYTHSAFAMWQKPLKKKIILTECFIVLESPHIAKLSLKVANISNALELIPMSKRFGTCSSTCYRPRTRG